MKPFNIFINERLLRHTFDDMIDILKDDNMSTKEKLKIMSTMHHSLTMSHILQLEKVMKELKDEKLIKAIQTIIDEQ